MGRQLSVTEGGDAPKAGGVASNAKANVEMDSKLIGALLTGEVVGMGGRQRVKYAASWLGA